MLWEMIPVILFFIAFKLWGIYAATAILMVLLSGQILIKKISGLKVNPAQWVTLIVVLVLGGTTLWLQDERFIKLKPSLVYMAMGAGLLAGRAITGKSVLQRLASQKFDLPLLVWYRLEWLWAGFFFFAAAANLIVAQHYSTEVWVNFKLFGLMGATFIFALIQAIYITATLSKLEALESTSPGIENKSQVKHEP